MPIPNIYSLITLFGIIFGAVQCYFGYHLFKITLGITGFIVGGGLAVALSSSIYPNESIPLIAGLVGGVIGATLSITLYYVGIFFIGALFGGIIGSTCLSAMGHDPNTAVIVIAVTITGILALIIQKYMIIISTSFAGAWLIVAGIAYFATGAVSPTDIEYILHSSGVLYFVVMFCWIILGITGIITQFKRFPKDQKREERDLAKYINSSKEAS